MKKTQLITILWQPLEEKVIKSQMKSATKGYFFLHFISLCLLLMILFSIIFYQVCPVLIQNVPVFKLADLDELKIQVSLKK